MKWYAVLSVIACALNSVLAAIILSLATYHLFTDKSTNAPIAPKEEWIQLVTNLIPFSSIWLIVSLISIFISMSRRQLIPASLVLAFYAISFGVSIYFTLAFGNQLEMDDVKGEALFHTVIDEINAQKSEAWIPEWLDNFQKQSKQCCGVVTYRDYEDFWPETPTKIPRSCCRDDADHATPCPEDLIQIPYPNTPDNYIKVETGCMDEINEATRHRILESYHISITMSTFLGCVISAFMTLFIRRYLMRKQDQDTSVTQAQDQPEIGGGDVDLVGSKVNINILADSGEVLAASSGQIVGSIDSMEDAQPLASVESLVVQDRKLIIVADSPPQQQSTFPKGPSQAAIMRTQQSGFTGLNKANTVFAGLPQQQFPDASTGDDMTVGGGNMGRREVFLAQEAKPAASTLEGLQNFGSRIGIPRSGSQNDVAGDIVRLDEDPAPNPPTGPEKEKRKKKGRKYGLQQHNHFERNP